MKRLILMLVLLASVSFSGNKSLATKFFDDKNVAVRQLCLNGVIYYIPVKMTRAQSLVVNSQIFMIVSAGPDGKPLTCSAK